ncbi:pentapeptide repeat-containing protein [Azospirillum sp. SYSU D00513]|uniref:pentapeptide repeat-containing protein n=1 Tax=Azospirillum sp. SYSU D00513 TaxID=2812561 RepID=UPI001A9624D4|nr:pentapeptide repeat-containing protein [Azospirillum sp. SYSU D00513]
MTALVPNDVETIKAAVAAHQKWLKHRGGRRADLSFRDLSRFNLERINLSGAKLAGANLAGARLAGADLSQADLFGADLEAANLTGASLLGADLRGANLHRALLTETNLRGADFRAGTLTAEGSAPIGGLGTTRLTEARLERAMLAGANFGGCDLTGADLNDADLTGANLSAAVLIGTDLSGATLEGVTFGRTVFDQATLARTYIPFALPPDAIVQPTYKLVTATDFLEAVTAHELWVSSGGAQGRRIDLDLAVVPSVELRGRTLSAARMRRCLLAKARLGGASLEMADLSYTDLGGSDLSGADLRGANLRRAHLARTLLSRADARPVALSGGRNWPANFEGADFTGADLSHAHMGEAVVHGARFGEARLAGTGIEDKAGTSPALPAPRAPAGTRPQGGGHTRFTRPGLIVRTGRGAHVTDNWSAGGLCLHAPDHDYRAGEVVEARVSLGTGGGPAATVPIEILHINRAKGQVTAVFHRRDDELKALLRAAVDEHHRLASQSPPA